MWRPILDGARAVQARRVVDGITAGWTVPDAHAGLDGAAARALLLAYAGRDPDAELDAAIAGVGGLPPGLHHGVAGVAFVLAHLGHDVDASVDDGLAGALPNLPFDLVDGVCGIGVYALERDSPALLARVIEIGRAHV